MEINYSISSKGMLEIKNLPDGEFDLLLKSDGYRNSYTESIKVQSGKTTDIGKMNLIAYTAPKEVTVTIQTPDGQPVTNGFLQWYKSNREPILGGKVYLPVFPDWVDKKLPVIIRTNPCAVYSEITIVTGENKILLPPMSGNANLVCSIRESGKAVQGAEITLISDPSQEFVRMYQTRNDALNRYPFNNIPPGNYVLLGKNPGGITIRL